MMTMVGDAISAVMGTPSCWSRRLHRLPGLIGTTLSCINTGARVTYAMGKDQEAPEHFGMLHSKNLTPHRAIWTLAIISAVVGCITVRDVFWRRRCTRRLRHSIAAARFLVQFRIHHPRQDGGLAQLLFTGHAGFELRHFCPLHAELPDLHRLPITSTRSSSWFAIC
jgi:hypothetical protein